MDEIDDEVLMAEYGIAAETKLVFHYEGHRYDRLSDAVRYARTRQSMPEAGDTPQGQATDSD